MTIAATEFSGKAVLVTGTSGIGRACAVRFALGGARVLACGIDKAHNDECSRLAAEQGLAITVRAVDVSVPDEVAQAVADIVARHGGLDIIVNAAAIHPYGDAVETHFDVFMKTMAVNVGSIHLMAHHGVPAMRKRGGGAIVNLASVQGTACQRRVEAYATSKGAIHSLTRALALDFAPDGIRVNSISPGSVRTPILEHAARTFEGDGADLQAVFARFGASHPLGRIGEPEEIAELAAFLASPRASFITGADFRADGGLLAQIGVA
jgi:NAD(P)-dependent dehydrogenase (short-subunit alcohol dehydrogenase family)